MIHREPSHPPRRSLAPEEIQTFADEGVVCLRGIIPLPLIDRLRVGIDQAFAEFAGSFGDFDIQSALNEAKAAGAKVLEDPRAAKLRESGRALLRTDEGRHNELIRDFAFDSPLAEIAAGLMKSRRIRFFQDQIFLKEPGASARMGFHQDLSYFPIAGTQCCVFWVPVDRVTQANGAMEYVRGSNTWGKTYAANMHISHDLVEGTVGEKLPLIEENPDDYDIVSFDVEPGDVIVHHFTTLHGSGGNATTDRMRRAASLRYCGDDITYDPHPGKELPYHKHSLKCGDPLIADEFPLLWPR